VTRRTRFAVAAFRAFERAPVERVVAAIVLLTFVILCSTMSWA
jgi:uncharacterized membrane protein